MWIDNCMKKAYQLIRYDAFTKTPGKGNPAGIMLDANNVTTEEMQDMRHHYVDMQR